MRLNSSSERRNPSLPLASRKWPTICPLLLMPKASVSVAPGMSIVVTLPSDSRNPCSPERSKNFPTISRLSFRPYASVSDSLGGAASIVVN